MSEFMNRHKRKSLLAALLLIFKGRAKYVAIMIMIIALSVPFVVSGDAFSKFVDLPAVASVIKLMGLSNAFSKFSDSAYSKNSAKSAFVQSSSDADKYSVWQKVINGMAGAFSGTDPSGTVAMVRAGEGFYDKAKPGQVKGVVSQEEKAAGGSPDAMNFEDMLSSGPMAGFEGGGDMGYGGSLSGSVGSSPYMNRDYISGGGVASRSDSVIASAMDSHNVPAVRDPRTGKIKSKTMGKLSGFSWRNTGYRSKSSKMDVRINSNRRALFQMSETFTMTASAYKGNATYEHQASYTGSTYDGNDINSDIIATDAAPSMPDTAYTGDLLNSANNWSRMASDCSNANTTYGADMSLKAKEISDIQKSMGDPPKCCNHGAVDKWNGKVDQMKTKCNQANADTTALAQKCQFQDNPENCNKTYDPMKIHKCSHLKCWLGIILAVLLIIIGAVIGILTSWTGAGLVIGAALIAAGAAMLIGQIFGGTVGAIASIVAGIVAMVFGGPLAMLAMAAVSWVSSKAVEKWGADDGSSVADNWGTKTDP